MKKYNLDVSRWNRFHFWNNNVSLYETLLFQKLKY
jgi:hypothetical protein